MTTEALKGWMTKKQCAEFLNVSRATLDRYCMGGRRSGSYAPLPRTFLGGRAYFNPEQVRAWAEKRGNATPVEDWSTL